ncbi:GntR family transcriptional regulator [Bradyrhizobium sp. SSBR45G]|uniref:GntR family transcriptional regulator n=1 Tax=unclassified Bradyrhizobium TaxID=2631580 RepID=UPI002342A25B|nr:MULTISPECIES: FCD domain-containing protein [unclassified Bradyrhizobium]GLH81241.1 GntR family transcriptional regulator [Bradyrhizobium sp. SSBR45G]GLH88739.1 GntR family transcriptional regulator [Bradyrhizobium sp. SSBR45R]
MSGSATQTVYEQLRASLLAGLYRPEEKLKISELGSAFAVSPGAIREALARLTAEGLVTAMPQRGFRVAPVSVADLRDLTDMRIEIETKCLRRAIANGDLAWEAAVVAAHHRLAATPVANADGSFLPDWITAHNEFHAALARACGSAWMLRVRDLLFAHNERYLELAHKADRGERDAAREHRELMEAALARDTERAVTIITAHLGTTRDTIAAGLVAAALMNGRGDAQ